MSGFELSGVYEVAHKAEYIFIINDFLPERLDLPRIKIDPSKTFDTQIEKNIRGVFDQKLIGEAQVQILLKHYLTGDKNFNLIDAYAKDFNVITSLKIHEYLNVGFFI